MQGRDKALTFNGHVIPARSAVYQDDFVSSDEDDYAPAVSTSPPAHYLSSSLGSYKSLSQTRGKKAYARDDLSVPVSSRDPAPLSDPQTSSSTTAVPSSSSASFSGVGAASPPMGVGSSSTSMAAELLPPEEEMMAKQEVVVANGAVFDMY